MKARLAVAIRIRADACERGAATLESVAMCTLAGVLATGLILATANASPLVHDKFRQAICMLTTLGQGSCGSATSAAAKHVPTAPCVVSADGHTGAVEAGAVVSLGANEQFLVEKLNNGTSRITRGIGTKAALNGGAGANVSVTWDSKTVGGAAKWEASVAASFGGGEVYYANNQEEINNITHAHVEAVAKETGLALSGPLGAVLLPAVNWAESKLDVGYPLPPSDEVYVAAGVDAGLKGQATALTANAQIGVAGKTLLGTRIGKDGTSTTYFQVSVDGNLSAGTWGGDKETNQTVYAKAGAEGKKDDIIEVERDSNGNITTVRNKSVVATTVGASATGGDVHDGEEKQTYEELVTELPIDTSTDQVIAERYFNAVGLPTMNGFGNLPKDVRSYLPGNPLDALSPSKEFAKAASDHGFLTRQTFDNEKSASFGVNADAEFLGKIGGGVTVDRVNRKALKADYWDGAAWATWKGCGQK